MYQSQGCQPTAFLPRPVLLTGFTSKRRYLNERSGWAQNVIVVEISLVEAFGFDSLAKMDCKLSFP